MAKKICRYVLDFYRSANLEGVFIMTDEELEAVKEIDGSDIHYGEVAGKHSDVSCPLHFKDIEILSDKKEEVEFFERILPHGAGFSFKGYWLDDDEAYSDGWGAGKYDKHYATAEDALASDNHKRYDNNVMRDAFKKGFKANTVYVYTDYHGNTQVFANLKLAKRFAQDYAEETITWKVNWRLGVWIHDEYGEFIRINRKKIIKA